MVRKQARAPTTKELSHKVIRFLGELFKTCSCWVRIFTLSQVIVITRQIEMSGRIPNISVLGLFAVSFRASFVEVRVV